jgi:saccharopine dehydrogenase (NAD+, L-glutamate forming)
MQGRIYDVVIFGATGFTGGLVAEYFARHVPRTTVRWAIAGRSPDKLRNLVERLRQLAAQVGELPCVLADTDDPASLARLAASTRVVVSTVGPFIRHGEGLFAACADAGTDYIDSTGEPSFVRRMIERYDARARATGARMISCCGVDSIPTDMGLFFTMKQLLPSSAVNVEGHFSFRARPSGGTWQSVLEVMRDVRDATQSLPAPPESDERRQVSAPKQSLKRFGKGWLVPFPTIDPQIALRSARVLPFYGPDVSYGHYLALPALWQVLLLGAGSAALLAFAQFGPTRALLGKLLASGTGPSAKQREKSWFRLRFIAKEGSRRLVTEVSGGDPGYEETAKMLAESALSLVQDRDKLTSRAGVLTPAVALGDVLLERLMRAGIGFKVVEG